MAGTSLYKKCFSIPLPPPSTTGTLILSVTTAAAAVFSSLNVKLANTLHLKNDYLYFKGWCSDQGPLSFLSPQTIIFLASLKWLAQLDNLNSF